MQTMFLAFCWFYKLKTMAKKMNKKGRRAEKKGKARPNVCFFVLLYTLQRRTYLEAFPGNCEHILWIGSDNGEDWTMTNVTLTLTQGYES